MGLPTARLSLHRSYGGWTVRGTRLTLRRDDGGGWYVASAEPNQARWLRQRGLEGSCFATRREAGQTLAAHLKSTPGLVAEVAQPRRQQDGSYLTTDGVWRIARDQVGASRWRAVPASPVPGADKVGITGATVPLLAAHLVSRPVLTAHLASRRP
jgi:hypothetical protein